MASKIRKYCDWCGDEVAFVFAATITVKKQITSRSYEVCKACSERLDRSLEQLKAERHR
jgi:hypothetical protein